ncbi:hypothetical protein [Vibrio coralliilyticus]|uniref:Uncharacterized protein n=1 Tax=Vibrio coralliilyticus TaxID=190893 RepID=A0AAP7DES3_9VIBR|nr:hypothetical protein [Vibrio coralliilyticus]NOI31840.1 hypothetical protein [Vibrio coralliilyticus]NOJ25284.1 hypothetical protein [Vibrio coralliilyticus]
MKHSSILTLLLSLNLVVTPSLADTSAQRQVQNALKVASKAERLPKARSVVVFGQSEAVVITDNTRWVVKGQLYDMWQNVEVDNALELASAAKLLPINTLKTNTTDLVDARMRPEKELIVTVFLDPFEKKSANVVKLLNTYAKKYQVRYIYTAMSQKHIEPFFFFACEINGKSAESISQLIQEQRFERTDKSCSQTHAMNSFGLTQFLHINQSPVLIAPNDVYHVGLPPKLMEWLKENEG